MVKSLDEFYSHEEMGPKKNKLKALSDYGSVHKHRLNMYESVEHPDEKNKHCRGNEGGGVGKTRRVSVGEEGGDSGRGVG
jgi:hypothetical protein